MADIRKIIIIFVVAILFAVLVFSVIEAVYPQPKYEDHCSEYMYGKAMPMYNAPMNCSQFMVSDVDQKSCTDLHGQVEFQYNSNGCATSYKCNTCNYQFNQDQEKHSKYVFYISAILSLIAIFIGMYLPAQQNNLNEWIGTGFMLGGAFALLFGTVSSFVALDRIVRPIAILMELILVIFIAYKKIGNLRVDAKK